MAGLETNFRLLGDMEFILFSNLGDVTILFLGCGTGWQENLYFTRDYTSCLFITVRNIQHLGSVLFLEIACPHHTRVMMIFIQSGKFPVGTLPLFGREQWTYNLNSVHFNLWIKFEEYVSVCVNFNSILKFSLDNQVVFMLLFLRVCIWKVTSI